MSILLKRPKRTTTNHTTAIPDDVCQDMLFVAYHLGWSPHKVRATAIESWVSLKKEQLKNSM